MKMEKERKKREKKKKKITDYMIGQKRHEICASCRFLFFRSWFKVSTARRAVNEGAQFSENVYSNSLWDMIWT